MGPAVDSGWANDDCLDYVIVLGPGLKNDLVHVSMKCMVWETSQFLDARKVVVLFLGQAAKGFEIVLGIGVR